MTDAPSVRDARLPTQGTGLLDPAVDWESLLPRALDGEGFGVAFQPIVDLVNGSVVGYEALARFEGYPVDDPLTWFEAADRLGRGHELQSLALRTALTARVALPTDTFLSVNVGPEVIGHPDIDAVWADHPDLAGVVVELTEHQRVDSYSGLRHRLAPLREAGALIALDDAGAGYAGLRHIVGLQPQVVKLDRSLIAGVHLDETKRALIEMIGSFAARIKAEVLAEGVELGPELETILSLGVTLGQGFLLARPGGPWGEVDAVTTQQIRSHAPLRRGTLRDLVEQPIVVRDHDSARTAFGAVESGRERRPIVFVDSDTRPVATVDSDGIHSAADVNQHVPVAMPISAAARRAVGRIPSQRFRPVMCVDDEGRLVGVVRVERIVDHLAGAASSGDRGRDGVRRAS